ncbi:MAG: hypothetical protein ACE5HO_15170 [bacterium]
MDFLANPTDLLERFCFDEFELPQVSIQISQDDDTLTLARHSRK